VPSISGSLQLPKVDKADDALTTTS
jgi:hypothetical protein